MEFEKNMKNKLNGKKKMEKEYMKGIVIFWECFCDIRLVGFYLDRGILIICFIMFWKIWFDF